MPEKGQFNLSEEYADLSSQVIDAADRAWAELTGIEGQILFIDQLGDMAIEGVTIAENALENLEARRARAKNDAAVLGAMAVQIDPEYVFGERQNGAEPTTDLNDERDEEGAAAAADPPAASPSPPSPVLPSPPPAAREAPSETPNHSQQAGKLVKRIHHQSPETKVRFMERASAVINFVISQGGVVQKAGRTSPSAQVREGAGMDITTWNNFNTRIRTTGILEYDMGPSGSRRIQKISLNRQRIIDLAEVGDLPSELIEAVQAMDEQPTTLPASESGGDPDFLA